jgi:hypothetical protein
VSRQPGEFCDLDNHEIPSNFILSQAAIIVSANEGVCAGIWLLSEVG